MSTELRAKRAGILGQHIRLWREQLGLTRRTVSERSTQMPGLNPISESYLWKCEMGKSLPSLEKVVTLSEILGRPVKDFTDLARLGVKVEESDEVLTGKGLRVGAEEAFREGDYQRALTLFWRLIGEIEHLGDSDAVVEEQRNLAESLWRAGMLGLARDQVERAMNHFTAQTPPILIWQTKYVAAKIYRDLGCQTLAELLAENILDGCGNDHNQILALNLSGTIHHLREQIVEARERYQDALALSRQKGYFRAGILQLNVGLCYGEEGRSKSALEFYHKALKTFRTEQRPYDISHTLFHIGLVHFKRGDYRSAEVHFRESKKISKLYGYHHVSFLNEFYQWKIFLVREEKRPAATALSSLKYLRSRLDPRHRVHEAEELDRYLEKESPGGAP